MSLIHRVGGIYRRSGVPAVCWYTGAYLRYLLGGVDDQYGLTDTIFSSSPIDYLCYSISVENLKRLQEDELTVDDTIETTRSYSGLGHYKSIEASQIAYELRELAQYVADIEPKTVMEIGTKNGGTLYVWMRYLDTATHYISLDLPNGDFGGGYADKQVKFFENFRQGGGELTCIRANSHTESTYSEVSSLCDDQGIDFLFVDGDHTYDGVKQDFEMYKSLVSKGGVIAFHDIVPHPNHPNVNVSEFWNEIKDEYETKEIIASQDQDWAGIGIVEL